MKGIEAVSSGLLDVSVKDFVSLSCIFRYSGVTRAKVYASAFSSYTDLVPCCELTIWLPAVVAVEVDTVAVVVAGAAVNTAEAMAVVAVVAAATVATGVDQLCCLA